MNWNNDLQFDLDLNQELLNNQLSMQNFLDKNQGKLNTGLIFKNGLSNLAGIASSFASGPLGWVGLGVKTLGDNIATAKSQFDMQGFKDIMNSVQSGYASAASSAYNTSDLLNLAANQPDLTDLINSQDYQWDRNILSGIGAIFGKSKTERDKKKALAMQEDLREQLAQNLTAAGNQVSNIGYRQGMSNYLNNAAMGGPLSTHGSDFTDDLIRVDNGGTHESNPLGGVPAGIDPMGIPNLVEEGETIWNNGDEEYVFSARLKTPKPLVKKFSLGGGKKGLTYAEASKKIAEKSGANLRPNDPISKRTKDAQLAELEESQEEKRMKIEQKKFMEALSQMDPEELQGLFATQPQDMQMPQQVPPQGVVEEPLMEEPVQGEGMYEPVGAQGFAYGGNLFYDGGLFLRINNGLKDGSVVYDPVNKTYTFINENGSKGSTYTQREYDIIKSTYDKNQARLARKGERATARQEARAARAQAVTQRSSGQITMPKHTTWADARSILENRNTVSKPEATKISRKTRVTPSTTINTKPPKYNDTAGPYINPEFDTRVEPNLRSLYTHPSGRSIVDLQNPWYSYLIPEEEAQETKNAATEPPRARVRTTTTSRAAQAQMPLAQVSLTNEPLTFQDSLPEILAANDAETQKIVAETLNDSVSQATGAPRRSNMEMLPTWMRYAPVVGGGLSVLNNALSPEDYSDYDNLLSASRRLSRPVSIPVVTIGDRIRRNPIDERLAVNQANQNFLAGIRGTMDNAGGNRAYRQFANNLLAYNNQGALSDIATKAYLANRQDALQTADFNRGTAIQNMNALNQRNFTEEELNSRREQAGWNALAHATQLRDAARRLDDQYVSADFSGLMESLGNIGRENEQRNWLTSLANEGLYNLVYGKNGELRYVPSVSVKCGGKIKTKKRRF